MTKYCAKCFGVLQGRRCVCGYINAPDGEYALALPNGVQLNGRYILQQVIGAGGFGITYKAVDKQLRRVCAIKEYMPIGIALRREDGVILPETGAKAGIYQHGKNRFLEEAYILQKLNHMPVTATVTDCFEGNGTAYFVMDFIHGCTLKQKIVKEGKIRLPEALNILSVLALSLERIHTEARIFHRDISPENIMLAENGNVKLLDFGSAKFMSRQANQHFTVVLKAGYAPPEQYSSKSIQGAFTDVYSLASTFYYMVTGKKLPAAPARVEGESYVSLNRLVEMPQGISDAIDHALRLNRQERTPTCGQFLRELNSGMQGAEAPRAQMRSVAEKMQAGGASAGVTLYSGRESRKYILKPDVIYRVGRSQECEIVVSADRMVSNQHLLLYYDITRKQFVVRDVSRNGTKIQSTVLQKDKYYGASEGMTVYLSNTSRMVLWKV